MRQAYGNLIIDNIDSIEYKPSTVVTRLFSFIFTHLGKYNPTKEEGVKMVVAKNMPRNFNKLENSFLEISVDVIIEYYQIVMTNTLTKEASDNYDLDLMNLFKKYGGAEGFKFDDKLSDYSI